MLSLWRWLHPEYSLYNSSFTLIFRIPIITTPLPKPLKYIDEKKLCGFYQSILLLILKDNDYHYQHSSIEKLKLKTEIQCKARSGLVWITSVIDNSWTGVTLDYTSKLRHEAKVESCQQVMTLADAPFIAINIYCNVPWYQVCPKH